MNGFVLRKKRLKMNKILAKIKFMFRKSKKEEKKMLNYDVIFSRLIKNEGMVLTQYICPAGYKTIGVGRNLDLNPLTKEEKEAFLRENVYGKCAYSCGGDLMDRQNIVIDFEDESVAAFTLSCGTMRPDRYVHIVGTEGEIEGKLEEDKFVYRRYVKEEVRYQEEIIDVSHKVVNNAVYGGHSGGDYGIMHDVVRYLNGDKASMSITLLDDSVESHLLVYAAEESRKTRKVIDL